ncbi:MAG: tetratricopeptide repeat protein [Mediterranea sp.]|jgi:tetratricopeptide (TPR) repeat protein|nr:tetratricopeptide repeat protein [Mediterranea sp.]
MKYYITLKAFLWGALLWILPVTWAMSQGKLVTPEQYARTVQQYYADDDWEEGKALLDIATKKFPQVSDLEWLEGKYWYNKANYDQARYHLLKAVGYDYNNVHAKQMLVDLEDITGNYSSAICYINELLEVDPYWEGLWRRKIDIYRKQGNLEESRRLLRRVNQIYPNDTILRRELIGDLETYYQQLKTTGRQPEAIEQLKELITLSPHNGQYYLDMCNLYLKAGESEKALEQANIGLSMIPNDTVLIDKKASILAQLTRYQEALTYLNGRIKVHSTPHLQNLYDNILQEYAGMENNKDPYVLYGLAWQRGKRDNETLNYLLRTSVMRRYIDDALYYIRQASLRYGRENKEVLYNEYLLYKGTNEKEKAFNILNRLYLRYPDDTDIEETLCEYHLKEANDLMTYDRYAEALPHTNFVWLHADASDMRLTAMEKRMQCYVGMKRYQDAEAVLDTLLLNYPKYDDATRMRALILDKEGHTADAMELYLSSIEQCDSASDERLFYVIGYEEMAVPYIKRCMQDGATLEAYRTATRLVALNPRSIDGLNYAIASSDLLGKNDDFTTYTALGFKEYPNQLFFRIKQAIVYRRNGDYLKALDLLRPMLSTYPDNTEVKNAFSECSEAYALQLGKAKDTNHALALLDSALCHNPGNIELKYAKGLVFETAHQPDSAYYYQQFYQPARNEQRTFHQHLKGLERRTFHNLVGLTYLRARYGDNYTITSLVTGEYTRITLRDSYTAEIDYAGRSGPDKAEIVEGERVQGGIGVKLQAGWMHQFSERWSGQANVAWSNRYFPVFTATAAFTHYLHSEWEVGAHAGYRRIDPGVNMITLGGDLAKNIEAFRMTSRLDLHLYNRKFYYNLQAGAAYYPLSDMHTRVFATAAIGTAPETLSLDQALPGSFAHINAQLGMGGQYLCTSHITLGLTGSWFTYCNFNNQYKNLYNIYAQLYLSF